MISDIKGSIYLLNVAKNLHVHLTISFTDLYEAFVLIVKIKHIFLCDIYTYDMHLLNVFSFLFIVR